MSKVSRAGESQFNELHNLVTEEFLNRIKNGEATTADLKAASDWLYKNDITVIMIELVRCLNTSDKHEC